MIITLSALLIGPAIAGCSKSLTGSRALSLFQTTRAYALLKHGVQPDGSYTNLARKLDGFPLPGADGLVYGEAETLGDITVTGIVQSEMRAAAHFHLAFNLSPKALRKSAMKERNMSS
jgi:hypothetical protein